MMVICLVLGFLLAAALGSDWAMFQSLRAMKAERHALETSLAAAERIPDAMRHALEESTAKIAELEQQHAYQKRRADDLFGIIDGVCKERDGIWLMYRTSAQQAGVAQSWLFRELHAAHAIANRYRQQDGKPPLAMPEQLKGLVEEFTEHAQNLEPEPSRTEAEKALPHP